MFTGNGSDENVKECICGTWYNTNNIDIYVKPASGAPYNYQFRE